VKPIEINDHWVRKQLTDCFTFRQKLKYELEYALKYIINISGRSGFVIPPVSMTLSLELIKRFVEKQIEEERAFISHHKILESRDLGSAANDLQSIIESLPDFQAYLYATDDFFRDHIEHQIRVSVLGNFLLSHYFDPQKGSARIVDTFCSASHLEREDVRKAWWIAGLFHDIGMPVQKLARNFNKIIRDDLAGAYKELNLIVPEIYDPIPDENLNRIFFEQLTIGLTHTTEESIKRALGWTNERKVDHGAVSALLLLKSIPKVSKSNSSSIQDLFKKNPYKRYLVAARAMMLHNLYEDDNCVEISFDNDPLAYFLVLCDEMQEWGRQVNIKERKLLDTRFQRGRLVEKCLLSISDDELTLSFEYKNQRAKDKCRFASDFSFDDKKKNFARLKNEKRIFPRLTIEAKDFVLDDGELIRTNLLEASTSQ
jgi:hypothetical protein